jgi:MFS family permease
MSTATDPVAQSHVAITNEKETMACVANTSIAHDATPGEKEWHPTQKDDTTFGPQISERPVFESVRSSTLQHIPTPFWKRVADFVPLQDEERLSPPDSEEDIFPEGGLRAWLVVASSFLMLFPSYGLLVAIGTFQDYWLQHQLASHSASEVGWIPGVLVFLTCGLGIWVGPLFDRYGPRWIALVGSIGYVAMMLLLAECDKLWQMILCCGILGGVSAAMLTTCAVAVVAHWFKERRGLAAGIVMAGSSCGGLSLPLILRSTLPKYGYVWSLRIIALVFLVCLTISNLLMKARLPPSPAAKKKALVSLSIFSNLPYALFTVCTFCFELVLFGGIGILPTYVTMSGDFPADTGFYLISVLNGVAFIGRILPGILADRVGRFNTLVILMVFTLLSMLLLWLPFGHKSLPALYAFAVLFGFGTGGIFGLAPACMGQMCKAHEFGRHLGTMYSMVSFATLVGIPMSGMLAQQVGLQAMVGFYCAILTLSLVSLVFSRWAYLGKRWTVMAVA